MHRTPHLHTFVWKEDTAMFNPLCSSTNQQLFKKNFAIKVATTDDFCKKWKPSRANHKIDALRDEQRWMRYRHW